MESMLQTLNSEEAVLISGFMIGFMYDFKFTTETLEYPLTTIFNSALSGLLTFIGAGLVAGFLHKDLHFIIPVTAVASCLYYKWKDLTPKRKNKKD